MKIKQEEIERLNEILYNFKSDLAEAKKEVATLKEELSVADERSKNAIQEREKL